MYTEDLSELERVGGVRAMLMVNHQDSGDVPMMMNLVCNRNMARTCTFIADKMFR